MRHTYLHEECPNRRFLSVFNFNSSFPYGSTDNPLEINKKFALKGLDK